MTAIREISNWEAISPVIRGLSRRRSRIRRRVGSERASHTGPPPTSTSVDASAMVHPEHVMLTLHISPKPCKEMDQMKSLIRYKTKPESADENLRLVEKVYEELAARDPGGIRYATLRLEDGVSFVHIFTTDSDDAPNGLAGIAAFAEFQRELAQRCAELPVAQAATIVGSYRLLAR